MSCKVQNLPGISGSEHFPENWSPIHLPPDVSSAGYLVGTSGYYFDDWIGIFNPPKVTGRNLEALSERDKLDQDRFQFYQKYFPFVEINNTFYGMPKIEYFHSLVARSKTGSQFTIKVYREISHTRNWDVSSGLELIKGHVRVCSPLQENNQFYSFLLQLEDRVEFTQKRLDYLISICSKSVKYGFDIHVEFRNKTWHKFQVLQSLRDSGIGICNTEIPSFKSVFPLKDYATTRKGYVRYSGKNFENWYPKGRQITSKDRVSTRNARYDYSYSNQEIEARVLKQLSLRQKTDLVAVAYNNHYSGQAVFNAIQNMKFIEQLELEPGS